MNNIVVSNRKKIQKEADEECTTGVLWLVKEMINQAGRRNKNIMTYHLDKIEKGVYGEGNHSEEFAEDDYDMKHITPMAK